MELLNFDTEVYFRFWKKLHIGKSCWTWNGRGASFTIDDLYFNPARMAWMLRYGIDPGLGEPVATCGTHHCCRWQHLRLTNQQPN